MTQRHRSVFDGNTEMKEEPTTDPVGMVALLVAKCELSADFALTDQDRRIFREIARELRQIDRAIEKGGTHA